MAQMGRVKVCHDSMASHSLLETDEAVLLIHSFLLSGARLLNAIVLTFHGKVQCNDLVFLLGFFP
jgi:hypothetical protein